MTLELLLGMVMAALAGTVLYTILGIIPGTDETAVIAPVTLALVLLGIEPIFVFTFFMAAITAHKVTDSVPVAVAGIPGGVMAAPMVEHAVQFKKHGQADLSIRKMASGSVVGTLVAVPISFLFAWVLMPVADWVQNYAGPLFFFGTIILALLAKNRLVSLWPSFLLCCSSKVCVICTGRRAWYRKVETCLPLSFWALQSDL